MARISRNLNGPGGSWSVSATPDTDIDGNEVIDVEVTCGVRVVAVGTLIPGSGLIWGPPPDVRDCPGLGELLNEVLAEARADVELRASIPDVLKMARMMKSGMTADEAIDAHVLEVTSGNPDRHK